MNTRLDGPGIAGEATVFLNPTTAFATVTPDTPTPPTASKSKSGEDLQMSPPETGEATDEHLEQAYESHLEFTRSLRAVYRLGVARGENRVCARLPRLWGMWKKSGEWVKYTDGTPVLVLSDVHARYGEVEGEQWPREYDPRTGGPKA